MTTRVLVDALLNLGGAADTFPTAKRLRIQRKIADRLCEVLGGELDPDDVFPLALAVHLEEVRASHREAFRKDPAGELRKLGIELNDLAVRDRGAA